MANKYNFTKDFLQAEYDRLGNFKAIALEHNIPRTTIEHWCKKLGVVTFPKLQYGLNHDFFSQDTEESFYWAGFIAADGCISSHKSDISNCITLSLSEKDSSHLRAFKDSIRFTGPIKIQVRHLSKYNEKWNDASLARIDLYSKKMISDLGRFGICPRKSLTYEFPEWIKIHPMKNHFMRGFHDGDGSVHITKETKVTQKSGPTTYEKLSFSLRGTEQFLQSYQTVLHQEIQYKSTTSPKYNNGIWQLRFSGNRLVGKICKFLYANASIYLPRKHDVIRSLL